MISYSVPHVNAAEYKSEEVPLARLGDRPLLSAHFVWKSMEVAPGDLASDRAAD